MEKEQDALRLTVDLWNKCLELPVMHEDDNNDIRFHLHAIQNILYARIGQMKIRHTQDSFERQYMQTPVDKFNPNDIQ